jgi:glycosyltransferase involved in cell wall biosynthesis
VNDDILEVRSLKFIYFANTDWYLFNFRLPAARRLRELGHEVVLVSPPGPYVSRIESDGFRCVPLPMSRSGVNPFCELATVARLARILSAERPDVLHNFTVKSAIYGGLAARVCGVPAVVQAVAGMGYVFSSNSLKARVLRPLVRQLMRFTLAGRAFRLILQNPDDVNTFLDEAILSKDAIRLIKGSGVDTERFFAPARRDGALTVVLCARLLVEKGVPEFAEAARILRRQQRDVRFVLIGGLDPGNPSAISREQVDQWVAEDLVSWRGHVAEVTDILHECHVMALPSFYREGVPRSLIEGAASGLAIITTNLPGCREVVTRDGKDGLWVRPRDASHLAELIARLDDDRMLLNRVAVAAQRRAATEFDERLVIDRTLDVYRELIPAAI